MAFLILRVRNGGKTVMKTYLIFHKKINKINNNKLYDCFRFFTILINI